ncbi:TAT-variant-translocated molybdopterin oxidoreductase [Terriglobus sp. 2YAB30_2]|uniref:TAT-variant-translocated molybdopterin oxidoreductase n=2 Tax=unclassified Terriglobus TaxID=2628988 RepID=UPI003F95A9A1
MSTEMNQPMQPEVVSTIAPAKPKRMTLAEVQAKLANKTGRRFWTSLDELAEQPGFDEMLREEFPRQASEMTSGVSRRGFMKVMGASFALAGLTGCTKQPDEPIYPYVKAPEDLVLGKPMYFATAHPFPTGAVPVLVKSDAFRPIKVDGNPEHPATKGKSDAFTQASVLDLYDPDRSQHVLFEGNNKSWGNFQDALAKGLDGLRQGAGLYILSETVTSPTLAAQWKAAQAKYPAAKLIQWEPVNRDAARAGSMAAFGEYVDAQYKLEDADVILSLDADFLSGGHFPGFLPLSAAYAERHRYEEGKEQNRLYVVESMPSVTGFKAEHRLSLKPSDVEKFALALAGQGAAPAEAAKFLETVKKDLTKAGGKAVVIPGEATSPAVHAAAALINAQIGAVGKTVVYTETVNPIPSQQNADLKALVADLNAGKVSWLVILGVNPVYSAPADLNFAEAAKKAKVIVHHGALVDETALIAHWHINKAHYLESWSDARAYDGTLSIIQPMIDPLYGGKTAHDLLAQFTDNPQSSGYDAVLANAKTVIKGNFEAGWRKALHDGWVADTAFSPKSVSAKAGSITPSSVPSGEYEISFKPDVSLYDGRYANNGWLQEVPKQVTHLSWDNAALMSMETMKKLGVEETEMVELTVGGNKVKAPVLMVPGHPQGSITVHVGFGSTIGRVATGHGFNAYAVSTSSAASWTGGSAKKTEGTYDVCVTTVHSLDNRGSFAQSTVASVGMAKDFSKSHSLAGNEAMTRGIIRYATAEEAKKNPGFAHEGPGLKETPEEDMSFFPDDWSYKHIDKSSGKLQNAWGMSIDLNSCTGCNACVISCYSENNIPVVGREQVKVGRNMQWIRIDTYFEGDLHAPKAHFQPMLCQHCENAGCEQVCPVGATVHTPEGLNQMVYNRCVGTRYCSNNCPYKVRRFNFLLYSDYEQESLKLGRNPDVSVRSRGVMEKCTYCVQRIQSAKIQADKENREVRDGDIVTACQQACPTDAIVFGNINDPASKVAKRKAEERNYGVLADLNYRPRTTYTAGVINPNPELELA